MERYNMSQLEFCDDCQDDVCRSCAVDKLQNSHFGRLLHEKVGARYSTWHWDDLEKFKHLMGPDVDPVLHGAHQAEMVVKPFCEFQNLGPEPFNYVDANLLYVTSLFHDAHEGITGDVPKPLKTAESDAEELKVNQRVVAELMAWPNNHYLLQGMKEVMGQPTSKLGRAFAAIELCGYLQTGIRAWSMRYHDSLNPQERLLSAQMGQIVSSDAAASLERYATQFPYVHYLLSTSAPALLEMVPTY